MVRKQDEDNLGLLAKVLLTEVGCLLHGLTRERSLAIVVGNLGQIARIRGLQSTPAAHGEQLRDKGLHPQESLTSKCKFLSVQCPYLLLGTVLIPHYDKAFNSQHESESRQDT